MVYVVLSLVREVGVHRVSELVSESVSVVKSVGVVEKNVGVNTENSARERARGLALVLVNVYPVLRIRAVKKLLVGLSERKGCLLYKLLTFFKADLHIDILNDRTVEVVHMKLVKTESLLSEREIALHRGDTVVYGVAEAVIYRYGNVVCKECRLAGICIASYVGEESVHLYSTRIGSGKGVDVLLELTKVCLKRVLSYSYVAALAEYAEIAVCKSYVLTVLILNSREGHINALKHLKGVLASASRVREHRHHSLLIGRKHVLLGAKHIVKLMSIGCKSFLFVKVGTEKLLACGEYLGLNEGYRGKHSDVKVHRLAVHLLTYGIAVVAALVEHSVEIYLLYLFHSGIYLVKSICKSACRAAKSALKGRKLSRYGSKLRASVIPRLARGEYVRKIPHKVFIHIFSFVCHNKTAFQKTYKFIIYILTHFSPKIKSFLLFL